MIVLTFGPRLNARSWMRALESIHFQLDAPFRENALAGEHIVIDLSEVGFVDFVSLGHLLVFIRAATDAGAQYSIRRPELGPLPGEAPDDPDAAIRRIRRYNCTLYLDQAGFYEVLSQMPAAAAPAHLVKSDATPVETGDEPAVGTIEARAQLLPQRHRRIMPYRWVPADFARGLTRSSNAATLEVGLRDLGLHDEDAAALAKGVLAELLENGGEHSGASRILLGGAIVQPEIYKATRDDFDANLRGFVDWAGRTGSPIVRLVIADAGRGIAHALAEAGEEVNGAAASSPVLAALDRRSRSATPVGVRGLWKVTRIVRGYRGALLITSGGQRAGRSFADVPEGLDLMASAPTTNGTLIECAVLPVPDSDALRVAGVVTTPVQRSTDSRAATLECATASLNVGEGLATADLDRIRGTLAGLAPGTSGLVIAVNVPDGGDAPDDAEIGTSVRQVLALAGEADSSVTVTLAFPTINRPLMSVVVDDLNTPDTRLVPGSTGRPILALAPDNRHFWAGGTPVMRHVLRALSAADQPLSYDELPGPDGPRAAEIMAAVRDLADHTGLLQMSGGRLSLRIRPQDAVDAMARYVADEIRCGIGNESTPGVWHGRFRTPNLRITSRWCNLDLMLSGLRLNGLAGFALASLVEDRLGRVDRSSRGPLIVRAGNAPHEMVAAFARSLNGSGEYFDSLDDMRLERMGQTSEAPIQVLLVTDLISTRRTLLHALTEVVEHELEPIGVATVVDARTAEDRTREGDAVPFPFRPVPLVSLAVVDMEPRNDEADEVRPIDPVLRRPEEALPMEPRPLVPQKPYVEALKRTGAARLGHIERPANRHYTAYVDPTRLFRETEWCQQVTTQLTNEILQTHRKAYPDVDVAPVVCLLYPGNTTDDLPYVIEELCHALQQRGVEVVEAMSVPRAAHGRTWHLPASLLLPDRVNHVVVIDSGANSGHTIRQLIRLAAGSDVDAITGVMLLSGLTDADALIVQQTATVRRSSGSDAGLQTVPLDTHHVARTAMGHMDERECAVCELRGRYRSMSVHAPVPARLEQHRDWLLQSLEPRSKQIAFQEQATDLLGAHVSQLDCVEYLKWRYDLREAALSTVRRHKVFDKVLGAAKRPAVRDALIRLLVAESHWMRSAPLWFDDCRTAVAERALSLLVGDAALRTEQMLRVQAVILLANAIPEVFASQFIRIVEANRYQQPVVLQAVLDALRLLSGAASTTSYRRNLVIQPLVQKLILMEGHLRDRDSEPNRYSEVVSLDLIRYLLSHGHRRLQPVPTDAQGAWFVLRDHQRSVADHDYADAMWRVQRSVELIGRGDSPEDLDGVREDWRTCHDFLVLDMLPNVHLLRAPLRDGRLLSDITPGDARWEQVLEGQGPHLVDDITIRIDELLGQVKPGNESATYSVGGIVEDLDWWYRFFLYRGAVVPKAVDQCPADLVAVLHSNFPDAPATLARPGQDDLPVFCSVRLLRVALRHIRGNAEKTHRDDPAVDTRFAVTMTEPDADHVEVRIRNTNSRPSSNGGGNGLAALDTQLRAFGGRVEGQALVGEWTWETSLILPRWRMATW